MSLYDSDRSAAIGKQPNDEYARGYKIGWDDAMARAPDKDAEAVCDAYAEENQRFADRIEQLETALADILKEVGTSTKANKIASGALNARV